jgi:hypothetical protein
MIDCDIIHSASPMKQALILQRADYDNAQMARSSVSTLEFAYDL